MMRGFQRLAALPIAAICLCAGQSVHGVIIAEDSFLTGSGAYSAGSNLNSQNPTTTGFSGAWSGSSTNAYQPGTTNLVMAGIANTGGSMVNNYTLLNGTRSVSRQLASYTGNDTLWFSNLVQFNQSMLDSSGVSGSSSFVGFLSGALPTVSSGGSVNATWLTSNGGSLSGFAWGITRGKLAVRYQSAAAADAASRTVVETLLSPAFTVAADTTYLLMARLNVNASGNDTLDIWMLQSAPADESALGSPTLTISTADLVASNTDISRLVAFSAAPYSTDFGTVPSTATWDAIRIGTAFSDLVTIPEPASVSLLGFGALFLLAKKRK